MDDFPNMFSAGVSLPNGGPRELIPREEWKHQIELQKSEEEEWFNGPRGPIRLMVELPFWLMMPDGEIQLSHDKTTLTASIRGHFFEISDGPYFFDSHANVVFVGSKETIESGAVAALHREVECAIFRQMRTVIVFEIEGIVDAVTAYAQRRDVRWEDHTAVRRVNRADLYLFSLAFAHIPFINTLITSYRSVSLDPFAVEVSNWDLPVWHAEHNGTFARVSLMPYWDGAGVPTVSDYEGSKSEQFIAATIEKVQAQAKTAVAAGKMELMNANSLYYRGRFGDAVRSAVTAIEVCLESQITTLLEREGRTTEQISQRLLQTKNSFFDRLKDFERLSGRRTPGPLLSMIPYINGIRLKSELDWVRRLRHDVVHEGIRVDIFSFGAMQRAIETMTWLYEWISFEDEFSPSDDKNFTFFNTLKGRPIYPCRFESEGVQVVKHEHELSDDLIAENIRRRQYLESLRGPNTDLELFAQMTFAVLDMECHDAPPDYEDGSRVCERFWIQSGERKALVFLVSCEALLDETIIGRIALRILSHRRTDPSGWGALCLVNHQYHAPAELRETTAAIPHPIDQICEECGISIVTALDLQDLVDATVTNGGEPEEIRELLFLPGRQGQAPPHHGHVGHVAHVYPRASAVSILLSESGSVSLGDVLSIRMGPGYRLLEVDSLEVDRQPVQTATGLCKVGVKTSFTDKQLIGNAVYSRNKEPGAKTSE